MFLFRFYKIIFLTKFLILLVSGQKISVRTNSIKPFHCTGRACDGQSLFGVCSVSHPYAFDKGKKCCNRMFDAENKVKDS